MKQSENELLESFIQRGKELQVKFKDARGTQSFIDFLRLAGNLSISDLGHQDREFLRSMGGQALNLLPEPLQDAVNDYYRWYLDCKNLFAVMKWDSEKRVRNFEETITIQSSLSEVKHETILEGQIGVLTSLFEHPPQFGTISWIRVVGFVLYLIVVVGLDYVVFPLVEASVMVGIVALELGLLELLPTLIRIFQR
ncbi:MAG: hypothetical protein ACW98Y_21990 [Candidatus Thorarchaeota archaeon]|jgi:hypothetical protein